MSQLDFSNVVLSLSRSEYKRGSFAPPEGLNERLHPICSMRYKLVYWDKDGDYLKFKCQYVLGNVDRPRVLRRLKPLPY